MNGLIKATWFSGLTSIVNVVSQVLKGKAQAVFLGTGGMGVLSQVLYYFNFSTVLASFGLAEGVVRYTSEFSSQERNEHLESFHITIFSILFLSSVVVSSTTVFLSDVLSTLLFSTPDKSKYVILAGAAIPFAVFARFFTSVLRGLKEVKLIAKVSVCANIFTLPLAILLTYLYGTGGAIVGVVIFHATTLVLAYSSILRHRYFNLKKFSIQSIRLEFVSLNKWYSASNLLMVVMATLTMIYVSRCIITNFGVAQNGLYAVTLKVSNVYFGMLCGAASTYYYPTLCSLENKKDISQEINNTLHYYVIILTPVVLCLVIFNRELILLLFSSSFTYSGALLAYHLPGDYFRIIYETMALALLAKGNLKLHVSLFALWCVMYVLTSDFFGQMFGLPGYSIGYTLSYFVAMVICCNLIKRIFYFKFTNKTFLLLIMSCSLIVLSSVIDLFMCGLLRYFLGVSLVLLWLLFVHNDEIFRELLKKISSKLGFPA